MALATLEDHQIHAPSSQLTLHLAALAEGSGFAPYSEWYLGDPQQRWANPAKEAYESAVQTLQKELTADEYQSIWLRSQRSMQDVQATVIDALEEYQAKSKASKARSWLASCSSRVMYYGAVFDMFSQHHPEYVSLAWGTMKFLFIAVLNHEELLVEISKAISKIAYVLPRTELHSILYPTSRMQEAVSLVYAKIIEFVIMAIKWYKKGKLMHSITSIIKPFNLSFKPIIEAITERSRHVDELANAASKAEIRDLHARIYGLNKTVTTLTEMIAVQQQQQTLHNQSLLALRNEYKQMFRHNQIEEIRSAMLLEESTPAPDESLAYCRSMRDRRRQKLPTQLPAAALLKLKEWLSDPASSLLLAQGQGVRTSCVDFAIDFLDAVKERDYPVLWALQSMTAEEKSPPSVTGILRSLICQALSIDSSLLSEGTNPVTAKHFEMRMTVEQGFSLLERSISGLRRVFLIIDMALIETAAENGEADDEFFKPSDFVERISELVKHLDDKLSLKIVVVSWKFAMVTSLGVDDIFDKMQMFTDMGRKTERLLRQPKYRSVFRSRNRNFAERFQSCVNAVPSQTSTRGL